jgi:hypothetical protein
MTSALERMVVAFEAAHVAPRGSVRARLGYGLEAAVHAGGVTLADTEGDAPVEIEIPADALDGVIETLVAARRAAARIAEERQAAAILGRALAQWGGARPAGTQAPAND